MNLTANQIIERGLLTDPLNYGQKAQIGYDLTVCEIKKMQSGSVIGVDKNKILPYIGVEIFEGCNINESAEKYWVLNPGVYSLTFDQFCKLDEKHNARIVNRSSMQRAGGLIQSGVFDPGFTSQIGATLYVHITMIVELHSRIAQFVVYENYEAEKYDGQYQGKKDRK